MSDKAFADYCWDFYGPFQLYGHFFHNNLNRAEINLALQIRKLTADYAADSFDREAVRDIILKARGLPAQGF